MDIKYISQAIMPAENQEDRRHSKETYILAQTDFEKLIYPRSWRNFGRKIKNDKRSLPERMHVSHITILYTDSTAWYPGQRPKHFAKQNKKHRDVS